MGELEKAVLTDAERALMRFTRTVTLHAYRTTDEEVAGLREVGWTDPQIAEAVYIIALFAFFNRVADAFGITSPGYREMPPFSEAPPVETDGNKRGIACTIAKQRDSP